MRGARQCEGVRGAPYEEGWVLRVRKGRCMGERGVVWGDGRRGTHEARESRMTSARSPSGSRCASLPFWWTSLAKS